MNVAALNDRLANGHCLLTDEERVWIWQQLRRLELARTTNEMLDEMIGMIDRELDREALHRDAEWILTGLEPHQLRQVKSFVRSFERSIDG